MYAKIENGRVVEYPLFEGDLEKRFPNIPFPLDANNQPVPDGYVRIEKTQVPEENPAYRYVLGTPKLIDGVWTHTYNAVPYTPEELAQRLESAKISMRLKRNNLLTASDWTQLSDTPGQVRAAYVQYRQALRDVPQQAGFPWNIAWPTQP